MTGARAGGWGSEAGDAILGVGGKRFSKDAGIRFGRAIAEAEGWRV